MEIVSTECLNCGVSWNEDEYNDQQCHSCGWWPEEIIWEEEIDHDWDLEYISEMSCNSSLFKCHNKINGRLHVAWIMMCGGRYSRENYAAMYNPASETIQAAPKKEPAPAVKEPFKKLENIDKFLKRKKPKIEKVKAPEKPAKLKFSLDDFAAPPPPPPPVVIKLSNESVVLEKGEVKQGWQYFKILKNDNIYHKYVGPQYTINVRPTMGTKAAYAYEISDNFDHFLVATSSTLVDWRDENMLRNLDDTERLLSAIIILLDRADNENNRFMKQKILEGHTYWHNR